MSYAKGMYQPVQLKISGFANYSGAGGHQVSIPPSCSPLIYICLVLALFSGDSLYLDL